jgi:hypothetical protein
LSIRVVHKSAGSTTCPSADTYPASILVIANTSSGSDLFQVLSTTKWDHYGCGKAGSDE